jgi:hypothetical protein
MRPWQTCQPRFSMIAAAMTVALSEPPAARLGARILLLPEEI